MNKSVDMGHLSKTKFQKANQIISAQKGDHFPTRSKIYRCNSDKAAIVAHDQVPNNISTEM